MLNVKTILVVGAGLMGSGIAQTAAEAGFKVYLNDVADTFINKGIYGITERWESKLKKGKIDADTLEKYKSNLNAAPDYAVIADEIDMVIEAASEKLEIKESIFRKVSEIVREDAVIASNTSSISISKLASFVKKPENFIGTHFFSPVPVMKLLEVIPGIKTNDETYKTALAVGEKLGKVCITSKDSAGFIVNRLLDPMLNEAIRMLDEGVGTVEDIDNGTKYGLGHPMGPFELLDMAGIDIECAVMNVMHGQTGNPYFAPSPLLTKMVESGMIGRKAGIGFYVYNEDGTKEVNPAFKK